jgi:SagB-type dehydrogenase family enzyme
MAKGIGPRFQSETKYERGRLPSGPRDWGQRPDRFKIYEKAERISLSVPKKEGGMPLWEAIEGRRSLRSYGKTPIGEESLSRLLWAAQGITRAGLRAAPSAGALYPIETYAAVFKVNGIGPGLYHYDPRGHALELLSPGHHGRDLARAAFDQEFIGEAGVVLIWTAVFGRSGWRYRDRAYRYIYLDAGHIAENVALAAVALGLGTCQIGALYDDEVNSLLGIDGEKESIVYMTSVGVPG